MFWLWCLCALFLRELGVLNWNMYQYLKVSMHLYISYIQKATSVWNFHIICLIMWKFKRLEHFMRSENKYCVESEAYDNSYRKWSLSVWMNINLVLWKSFTKVFGILILNILCEKFDLFKALHCYRFTLSIKVILCNEYLC